MIKKQLRATKREWRKDITIDETRLEENIFSTIKAHTPKQTRRLRQSIRTATSTGFSVLGMVCMTALCMVLVSGHLSWFADRVTGTNPPYIPVFLHSLKKFNYHKYLGFQPLLPNGVPGLILRSTMTESLLAPKVYPIVEFTAVYQYENNVSQTVTIREQGIGHGDKLLLPRANKPWVPVVIAGIHAFESSNYKNGYFTIVKVTGNVLFEVHGTDDRAISIHLVHDSFVHLSHAIKTAPDVIVRSATGFNNAVKVLPFRPVLPRYVPHNYRINQPTGISAISKTYMLRKLSHKSFANFSASYKLGNKSIQLFESIGLFKLQSSYGYTLQNLKVSGRVFTLQVPSTDTNSPRDLWWYDSKHNVTYNLMGSISDARLKKIALSVR